MTTAEKLALAVLKGDDDAVWPLIDALMETTEPNSRRLPPIRKLTCAREKLRVAVFCRLGHPLPRDTVEGLTQIIEDWLVNDRPIIMNGVERLELYELP
jgi:hypothetical protein